MNITTGKKNLAQISKVLSQITNGFEFGDDMPSYVPINVFVGNAIQQISTWFHDGNIHPSLISFLYQT